MHNRAGGVHEVSRPRRGRAAVCGVRARGARARAGAGVADPGGGPRRHGRLRDRRAPLRSRGTAPVRQPEPRPCHPLHLRAPAELRPRPGVDGAGLRAALGARRVRGRHHRPRVLSHGGAGPGRQRPHAGRRRRGRGDRGGDLRGADRQGRGRARQDRALEPPHGRRERDGRIRRGGPAALQRALRGGEAGCRGLARALARDGRLPAPAHRRDALRGRRAEDPGRRHHGRGRRADPSPPRRAASRCASACA